ncbi:dTDP-4-dehydrorhamnose 3,5-epimerase [Flavobacterium sp. xlx-214]|uniref:dTDP-4-dehydrorhamnose 3,5-epimerase n=1 Tax=unclassified Flavobacterium TaxID=196869 RepID=UPI0013D6403F|nr:MULTISPECIES: dTDP-4-dehydrorhamnose 3,5-epimerase [unclassified Flavobacterium]MBA5794107.1 dTDP-4-dehydrorhamnose 3,5-epimerase [Flavobacterium sp. xlx-221]QMI82679.1 dTDP-4-dehydrorhamnose 3,5-epimerase [Flavobacterium sp. xlx-214]QMI83184.1 dTDP-4-dehydrorhamnose 3,5-epimerase [Flavobacterium sp. xlx-214]
MTATETHIKGCFIVEPRKFEDERGYFFESFNEKTFNDLTQTNTHFVQDNQSYSKKGVIRGLHAQGGEHAQAKLVRVLKGEVIDVAVDARPGSPTFGQHVAIHLTAENNKQLFVPRGFLHGFSVLSDEAVFFYKCDNFYNKESEQGILYNSPDLNIDWGISVGIEIVSEKDIVLPTFNEFFNVKL